MHIHKQTINEQMNVFGMLKIAFVFLTPNNLEIVSPVDHFVHMQHTDRSLNHVLLHLIA